VTNNKNFKLNDFLKEEELNQLSPPTDVKRKPEAIIAEWNDLKLLITKGSSLATYADRFKGPQSHINERYLSGFEQEFSENGELVAFANEEISEEVGDTAVSNFAGIEGNFVTDIRDPEEAREIIDDYSERYPGEWNKLEDDLEENKIVFPTIHTHSENYSETVVAVRPLEGVQANDKFDINRLLEEEAEEIKPENLSDERYEIWEAPKSKEARYYIQFEARGEELEYDMRPGSIAIFSDENRKVQTTPGASEIINESSNNGIYFLEIG
jgi:hypothetical protein